MIDAKKHPGDLQAWLSYQIDVDQRLITAADRSVWRATADGEVRLPTDDLSPLTRDKLVATVAPVAAFPMFDEDDEEVPRPADVLRRANADYIANWDPARAEAECEAKRSILRRHVLMSEFASVPPKFRCQWCNVAWPCADVLGVAAVYRGRDGWSHEWWDES